MLRALLWDVDGTLAETERDGHRVAFNRAFEAHGLAWRWGIEAYGELLKVAGGKERLLHDIAARPDAPRTPAERDTLAERLHRSKDAAYRELVATGRIALRPGVVRLLDECAADGIRLAVATTTSRGNVVALLDAALGRGATRRFDALLCAEDAPVKKPDPTVYRLALAALGVAADDAIAIEDSPNGLAAARAAGIVTLVTRSVYFQDAAFDGAAAVCDDLETPVDGCAGRAPRTDVATLRALLVARDINPRSREPQDR